VLVEEILRRKGRDVATIGRDASAAEAVAALRQWGVGALVVSGGAGTVDGIVSERDLVRAMADGASALDRPVHALMSAEVVTCDHQTSTEELMAVMTERRIRHVPVVEDGRLAGIVSIGDVVKVRVNELEAENGQLVDYIRTGR
jgi:CBS domain-containing protein